MIAINFFLELASFILYLFGIGAVLVIAIIAYVDKKNYLVPTFLVYLFLAGFIAILAKDFWYLVALMVIAPVYLVLALVIKGKLKKIGLAYLSTNVIATALMLYFKLVPVAPAISSFVIVLVFWYFYEQVINVYQKKKSN